MVRRNRCPPASLANTGYAPRGQEDENMTRASKKALAIAVGGIGLSLLSHAAAKAATQTWNSTTSQDWFNSNNWSGSLVPASGDIALFGAVNPSGGTVNLSQGTSVGAIILGNASTKALTINGSGFNVNLAGEPYTETVAAGTFSFQNVVMADASSSKLTTGASLNFTINNSQSVIAVNQPTTLTFNGSLSGTTNLTIDGAGTSTT